MSFQSPAGLFENSGLFTEMKGLRTSVITKRRDFEGLFEGFQVLKAVTYVASPDLLLEFFEKRGYREVEVVVGENLSDAYRQGLAQKGADSAERLAERVLEGVLHIWVPAKTIHTKLYRLERPDCVRIIITSANFTETARKASAQVNYAWYFDGAPNHPWLKQIEADFQKHKDLCQPFMGDLADLIRQQNGESRRELIEAWLQGTAAPEMDSGTKLALNQIAIQALAPGAVSTEPIVSIKLPEAPAQRRELERFLAPLNPSFTDREIRLEAPAYISYVHETQGLPLLAVDRDRSELRIGFEGQALSRTETLPNQETINQALAHVENYMALVDRGQTPDPKFAKTSMMEALLGLFAAPFAHEYMKERRRRFGSIDTRGPRFLYIYGPSQNGKSTFLRFVLRLIAGRALEPLNGTDFGKRKILGAASVGTVFPLIFDDMVISQKWGVFEEVLKSYWEVWWREDFPVPQIVVSSNMFALKEWAKSRLKRIDFDVHFAPSLESKEQLARLFAQENQLFAWFSHLYLGYLKEPGADLEDELALARRAFQELYRRSARSIPDYFPAGPIEKLYDAGQRSWRDLVHRLKKARIDWEKDRASIHFAEDLQYYEIKEYEGYLPQTIKHRRRGKALVIETPQEFRTWIEGERENGRGWWGRLLGRT